MLCDYIVVDLEMTGLNPKTDHILEIGAVKVIGKQIDGMFSRLIRQECALDEQIIRLTGITDEMAAEGEELDAVMEAFGVFAGDLAWVGHNIIFDFLFVKQWEVNHRIKKSCYAVDTLKIARKCLPDLKKKTLDYLCEYYQVERDIRHRALEDAKANQALYELLERQFLEIEPEFFTPKELWCNLKRQTPATPRQKKYLQELAKRHNVTLAIPPEQLSRNEASRLTNQILQQYGRG